MADRVLPHIATPRRPWPVLIRGLALATIGLIVLFGALAQADAGGQAILWENAHWSIATIGAFSLAMLGVRSANPEQLGMRRLTAVALALWVAGQAIWVVQVALNDTALPGPSDVFFLSSVIPIILVLRELAKGRLRLTDRIVVALDSLSIFFALAGLILLVFGPQAMALEGLAGATLLLYPLLLLAVGGIAVVIGLAVRTDPRLPGVAALVGGILLIGVGQTIWVSSALGPGPAAPSVAGGVVISLGLVFAGWGGATWTGRTLRHPIYDGLAAAAVRVLPILAVATAILLVLADDQVPGSVLGTFVDGIVVAIVTIAAFRQAFLLHDRAQMLDEVGRAHRATSAALLQAEASESIQRRAADERGRLLAAGQFLLVGADRSTMLDPVLELLVPAGAIGFVCGQSDDRQTIEILAARGPGTESIVGLVRELSRIGPELRLRYDDPVPRAYRRRAPTDMPAGVRAQPFCDDLVVPDAAATLALPLFNRAGQSLGSVNLIDPDAERILDPSFIEYARLVTNQMSVALQNLDLVEQLREQIAQMDRVQEHLIQASKLTAIGELAAAVAHEVNNPLTGVLGYSDLLLAEKSLDSPDRESLEIIRSEAIRARTIIRALMEFARPSAPARRSVDVNSLVRSTVDVLRYHLTNNGVTVVERYGELPMIDLDEDAIQQVILHLLNNAAQAMPESGILTLTTDRDGGDLVITVSDTGPGMPEYVRARIFEPFFTTRPAVSGHGLGLSVSLGLVRSHGGSIIVASTPGLGTRVDVRLPMVEPAATEGRMSTWGIATAGGRVPEPPRVRRAGDVMRIREAPAVPAPAAVPVAPVVPVVAPEIEPDVALVGASVAAPTIEPHRA